MSNNKRAPKELQKYVVVRVYIDREDAHAEEYHYFKTQREAKEWAASRDGKKQLYKINYDSYGEIK